MASVILGAAGSAVGSSLGSISVLGVTLSGSQIMGAVGAYAGSQIDAALMPSIKRTGSRLSDISLQTSTEGTPVPRVYGRLRLAGQLLWATRFKEGSSVSGGKGGASRSVETTGYNYSISFAVGLCEGPITRLGRVWADGNLIDLSQYTLRLYKGGETQQPDPLIEEVEGAGNTPAYRGLCYVVFEDMPLAAFGNRIPQLQFEVVRMLTPDNPEALENRLTSVAVIPGAGEFVYAPLTVTEDDGAGKTAPLNDHNSSGVADWTASLDELQALAPNLKSVSLVVGWFGDDLRAAHIAIKPGVEEAVRSTYPESWSVAGISRLDAHLISRIDDRPAYGGTPSDDSVSAAIADLKARGLAVTFYPFVFMDIASGNSLPNPYSDNAASAGQPVYPWRGRITVCPAAGYAGTADQTAAAAMQIDAFFAAYRPMVLHYAQLCATAGGVDAFLIGSELTALTRARSATYPAVAALQQLAAAVRAILPEAKIGYAADWSEYNAHQTGNGALCFNLDPLWADANIDFIGIDNYLPLSDWRDGLDHLDAAEFAAITDRAYLGGNIRGGEDYDWYYASEADRAAQRRTAITDGLGKPWVWRAKDIWNWWASRHYDRPGGIESATSTAWLPQSKPIRFTELGCPAVDKGANQPNVFYDPKSSESFFPHFSNGARDDLIQRRFLEAHLNYWREEANNPLSPVYNGPMLDTANLSVWCWDARPFPFFPDRDDVWGDTADYATGHWLNGRLGTIPLADLVAAVCREANFTACDTSRLDGLVTGFAVTDTLSVRDALSSPMAAYFFDAVESEGLIKFVPRGRADPVAVAETGLVLPEGEGFGFSLKRAQETDLPNVSRVSYLDADDYAEASVESRRLVTPSVRVATSSLSLVLDHGVAQAIGDKLLQDAWVMREAASFALPPSSLALEPTDEVVLAAGGRARRLRLTQIDDSAARQIEAVATDPSIYESLAGPARSTRSTAGLRQPGRALAVFLDLPLLSDDQNPNAPFVAAYADPWPGSVVIYRDGSLALGVTAAASIGVTTQDFWPGPLDRWDRVNTLCVKLIQGPLASVEEAAVFGGANLLAVENSAGDWELVQFATAELTAPSQWRLTKLLRGRQGSEHAMQSPLPAGARVVVINQALVQIALSQAESRLAHTYIYGPAGKPLTDPAFQTVTKTFAAAGLVPPAPCHVRFAWAENGDLTISWKRRDRSPAAAQILRAETPLSDSGIYDLEILSSGAVVRTFSAVPQSSQLYAAAQQAADFPAGLPNPLVVRVYQRSSVIGRGRCKTESLYVR